MNDAHYQAVQEIVKAMDDRIAIIKRNQTQAVEIAEFILRISDRKERNEAYRSFVDGSWERKTLQWENAVKVFAEQEPQA